MSNLGPFNGVGSAVGSVGSLTGNSASSATPHPRLVKAAHEFEAAMMKELLAPLEQSKDILGSSDEESGSNSALGSFAGEALGKAISEHGGFGIARSILAHLSPPQAAVGSPHAHAKSNPQRGASVP